MKTLKLFMPVLLVLAMLQIAKGQSTYQTALRISNYASAVPDSNTTLQAGVDTGCALVTSQPIWMYMGFCKSGNIHFEFHISTWQTFLSTFSFIAFGPFTDTNDIGNKLTAANIIACENGTLSAPGNSSRTIYFDLNNYQRGEIYEFLITSTKGVNWAYVNNMSILVGSDTIYCPMCNSRLSELNQPICTVTYDSASQKNKLIWERDVFARPLDYVIFRQNASGLYDTIAYQSISQLSEWMDSTSVPAAKSYIYKMSVLDSCGHFKEPGNGFTTMHLIAYPTGANSAGLIWNEGSYNGSYYGPYLIYRTDQSGMISLIDSVASGPATLTYTDVNAPAGANNYQIGVRRNPACTATLLPIYDLIKSNYGNVVVTGINEITDVSPAITVEPNPMNEFTKIDLHLLLKQNLKIVLKNITAQEMVHFDDVKSNELIIHKNKLTSGLYFLEVTGDNFYARKKIVIN